MPWQPGHSSSSSRDSHAERQQLQQASMHFVWLLVAMHTVKPVTLWPQRPQATTHYKSPFPSPGGGSPSPPPPPPIPPPPPPRPQYKMVDATWQVMPRGGGQSGNQLLSVKDTHTHPHTCMLVLIAVIG
jgi:hypothetical protein